MSVSPIPPLPDPPPSEAIASPSSTALLPALARVLTGVISFEELDRVLLAYAVHADGLGLDRARLLLCDAESRRLMVRSVVRAALAPGSLIEVLRESRFAARGGEGRDIDHERDTVAPEELRDPAASALRHGLKLVLPGEERGRGTPHRVAAMVASPAGPYAVISGECDSARAVEEVDGRLDQFVALAQWAIAELERRSAAAADARRVTAIAELARAVASPSNLAEALHQTLRAACLASSARGGAVWRLHPAGLKLEITHGPAGLRDRMGPAFQNLAQACIDQGRVRLCECAADEALLSPDAAALARAFVLLPLRAYDKILGVLAVYDPAHGHPAEPRSFGAGDREALTAIADQAAVAIDQAMRFSEIKQAEVKHRELAQRLVRQERLAALGEAAVRNAREARNPLASIRTFARRTREALIEGAPEREYLEIVLREVDRLEAALAEPLDAESVELPSLQLRGLNQIVQAQLQRVGEVLVRRRIRLLKKLAPDLPPLLLDAERIGDMMSRVIENALDSVSIGGRLRIETRRSAGYAVIEVAHDGPRHPGTALDHLFVPFATSRGGSGLALGVAQRIVREHGGEVRVKADGEWSTVLAFSLPIPDNQDRRHARHDRRQIRGERRQKPTPA